MNRTLLIATLFAAQACATAADVTAPHVKASFDGIDESAATALATTLAAARRRRS